MGSLFIPYHVEGATSHAADAIRRWGLGGEHEVFFSLGPRAQVDSIATAGGRCWGWRSVELQGKPFLDFIHPEDRETIRAALAAAGRDGEALGTMARFLAKDGAPVGLVCRFALSDHHGVTLGFARELIPRKPDPA